MLDAVHKEPMTPSAWTRLERASWISLITHLAAGLSMAGILRLGLETIRSGETIEGAKRMHSMISDPQTGDLKPELLDERVLSAIIEMAVPRNCIPRI